MYTIVYNLYNCIQYVYNLYKFIHIINLYKL